LELRKMLGDFSGEGTRLEKEWNSDFDPCEPEYPYLKVGWPARLDIGTGLFLNGPMFFYIGK
jgi:hypothetical protein